MKKLEITILNYKKLENFFDLSSEYYLKGHIKIADFLRYKLTKTLDEIAFITDGEHGSPEWDDLSNIKYLTAECIRPNLILDIEFDTISFAQNTRNSRASVQENDVLVYSVGAYAGYVAKAEKHLFPANIPRSVAIVRLNENTVKPEYLSIFLNSKYGIFQTKRFRAGNAQPMLALEKIKQFTIPVLNEKFSKKIADIYNKAYEFRLKAKNVCSTAENLLLNALGIANFSPTTKNTTEKSFKDSFIATGRLDAEYYQPKYDELEAEIAKTHELAQLKDLLTLNQRGTQPNYAEQGLPVINSKHVREGEVLLTDNRFATLSEKAEPLFIKKGDVLINGTGVGTIGRSACYLHEQNALPDNHVTILRTDKINPVYLSVYLNSIAGKYQVDKYFKGSSGQIELYPKDIDNFYIPVINKDTQNQIADLVQQSFILKAESEHLLEIAKRAVEMAIETDEQTALYYINEQTGER